MRAINVKRDHKSWLYVVTLKYNLFEKIFGFKDKDVKLKSTDSQYTIGGQNVYRYEDGSETPNRCPIAEAIDKFRNKW